MNTYLIIKPILSGILAALGALFLEVMLEPFFPFPLREINTFFILAIFIEEAMKTIMILQNKKDSASPSIFIWQSIFVGLGFWIAEFSIKKLFNSEAIFFINIGTLFVHLITALIIGWFVSQKEAFSRIRLFFGFLLAFLIHLIYNTLVFLVFLA